MSVLVVGSVAMDTIETPFGKAEKILGGSATYFSIACSFFNQVKLVAVVGKDFKKDKLKPLLRKNIDIDGLKVESGETFRWHGRYSDNLNYRRTVQLELNVFQNFNPVIPKTYQKCRYIFLANIDPKLQWQVLKSTICSKLVAVDTIDHWINNQKQDFLRLLKNVNILILNDSEARLLSQKTNLLLASRWIQTKGPQIVVIKKGEHGILLYERGKFFTAPAYPLETIFDPTGAGDTFAGGFIGFLSTCKRINHKNLRIAAIYGEIMGSFCVEKFGVGRLSKLNKRDINKRLQQFKKMTYF